MKFQLKVCSTFFEVILQITNKEYYFLFRLTNSQFYVRKFNPDFLDSKSHHAQKKLYWVNPVFHGIPRIIIHMKYEMP